jgi:hypothetical protein
MAKLSWNVVGWIYQDGITHLRGTFEAATDGINRRAQDAYRAVDEYDAEIEAGAPRQVERTDDGDIVSDYRDVLLYHTETAEDAKWALNKAFAVAMFHHWERSARDWTGREHGGFDKLVPAVEARGYPISPKLSTLNRTVNLLKHANPKDGVALYNERPDLFRRSLDTSDEKVEWYEEVRLKDEHVFEFFDVLAASGPTGTMVFGRE